MENKAVIAMVILLAAILSLVFVYSISEVDNSGNRTELTVSSEGPVELSAIVKDIKTASYYEGYDNDTVKWMESLRNKKVFVADDAFVIMGAMDASKLRSEFVCDAYIEEFMECTVLENHSLGDVKYPRDVLLVNDVKYLGEELHNLQGS